MRCNVCDETGWMNLDQFTDEEMDYFNRAPDFDGAVLKWVEDNYDLTDVQVCTCCGDGETWYGEPGQHYGRDDPMGEHGPYAYNGGLCKCH